MCGLITSYTFIILLQTTNSVDPVAMMKHSMSGISDQQVSLMSESLLCVTILYQFNICCIDAPLPNNMIIVD